MKAQWWLALALFFLGGHTFLAAQADGTSSLLPPASPAPTEGEKIFRLRCFVCHGWHGKGDGPASNGLGAKPRDLTAADWQQKTSDNEIGQVIRAGGQAIGESSAMPANPDLSQAQVQSLVDYIRTFAR